MVEQIKGEDIWCNKCEQYLPMDQFAKNWRNVNRRCYCYKCRDCQRSDYLDRKRKNKGVLRKRKNKRDEVFITYGDEIFC